MNKLILTLIFILSLPVVIFSLEQETYKKDPINKPVMLNDVWLDVNRMNGAFRNNGIWHYDAVARDWGLEWPKGSGLSPIFAAGQIIGARVNGDVRVAGVQYYTTEFQPGMILEAFVSDDPTAAKYRWYSIEAGGVGDWLNWPVDQGAPIDNSGKPHLIGSRTLYSVWNDLAEHEQFGTEKLSIEVHQTVFAFDQADAYGDMQFMKWLLVNKSGFAWDSTYFSIFIDADIGAANDDLVGCDTKLDLGFCYNATDNDQNYGTAPPAAGVDLLQGPIIDKQGSTIKFPDGTILENKEMLKMTSFLFYNNDDTPQGNPHTGNEAWNFFRGRWRDGSQITEGERGTNPANPPTPLMFTGDPETNEGWLDSDTADRRFLMTSGPFKMEVWDDKNNDNQPEIGEPGVQEIVAVVLAARGLNNLNSVTELKKIDAYAQRTYNSNFLVTHVENPVSTPSTFYLNQNFPNPFNPSTIISYQLPKTTEVKLIVYNLQGKKVATLVSERQQPGHHQVEFIPDNLSSGIYFYKIKAGDFQQVMKMVFVR